MLNVPPDADSQKASDDAAADSANDVLTEKVMTLPERADEVERRLGMALKAYRQRAEDILDQHFDQMEKAQIANDHEVSMLRAENSKLRQMIGKPDDPTFPQNVLFQTVAPVAETGARKKDAKVKLKQADEEDEKRPARKGKKGQEPETPGGTWQQFVAWVPNGSALGNAEPWKPLPDQICTTLVPTGSPALKAQRSVAPGQGGFLNVLPGAMQHEKEKKHSENDDDSDNNSDEEEDDGKVKLELIDMWLPSEREKKLRRTHGGSSDMDSKCEDDTEEFLEDVPHSPFIINPDSNLRITWDLCSLFMVVYDMVMIPMAVFTMPNDPFLIAMDWSTRIFWTLDMGWSCCTGVVLADGRVEYNLRFILKRYLKSWFGLDFFIVGSDWSGVILSSGGMGLSRLARVSRIARVVRLLRLVRMQEVIANITERIQSDNMILVLKVGKVMVFLIACCHATACGWWGVGNSTNSNTWIKEYGYDHKDVGLQYLVSLHWSLSQFSGGLEEFGPRNGLERFYTVLIWVVSFISGLVMLSFLTSSLTQQYIIGGSGARQMATLKKYLNQNKIPKNLIKRLCRSAKHAISGDLQPDSVDLLHVVSEPLKIEMHFQMYSKVLNTHPFFMDFINEGYQVMRRVCHSCMSMVLLDSADVLFRLGDEPPEPKMYFVCSGTYEYKDKYGEIYPVVEKMWLSEAALWTNWKHHGDLTAVTNGKMAVIDAEQFQEVCAQYIKKTKGQGFNPKVYAAAFIKELNEEVEWSDLAGNL